VRGRPTTACNRPSCNDSRAGGEATHHQHSRRQRCGLSNSNHPIATPALIAVLLRGSPGERQTSLAYPLRGNQAVLGKVARECVSTGDNQSSRREENWAHA